MVEIGRFVIDGGEIRFVDRSTSPFYSEELSGSRSPSRTSRRRRPRVNPYAQKFLDWIARSGEITTQMRYRVVGDHLEAANEIVVEQLSVARAGRSARSRRAWACRPGWPSRSSRTRKGTSD